MPKQTITESEYTVMKILWSAEKPISLGEIIKKLPDGSTWSRNTVGTLLTRLCDKGVAAYERHGKANLYYAVLCEKDYSMDETKSLLSKLYKGSVGNLVASLYESREISENEIAKLREIIEK